MAAGEAVELAGGLGGFCKEAELECQRQSLVSLSPTFAIVATSSLTASTLC